LLADCGLAATKRFLQDRLMNLDNRPIIQYKGNNGVYPFRLHCSQRHRLN
jgi:hypothetical protein